MNPEALLELLTERRSIRGFSPTPLAQTQLDQLFAIAQRAPSWCNIQPWRADVASGTVIETLRAELVATAQAKTPAPELDFPSDYPDRQLQWRRACGKALYEAMGVAREDHVGRAAAWLRNYELFDAPHLAVVSRPRALGEYATLDVGVWLGYLFAAAAAADIAMCAMASVAAYPGVLRAHLPIPEDHLILFGIVLGREDSTVAANQCRTERAPVYDNIVYAGGDDDL